MHENQRLRPYGWTNCFIIGTKYFALGQNDLSRDKMIRPCTKCSFPWTEMFCPREKLNKHTPSNINDPGRKSKKSKCSGIFIQNSKIIIHETQMTCHIESLESEIKHGVASS